jgi:AmmeMemoRadiSam system protein A
MMAEELCEADRQRLLEVARQAIASALGGPSTAGGALSPALGAKRGAFVTLTRRADGELRGCIGYIEPLFPLAETVARAAAAAALHDHRFDPVTREQLSELDIEVSVLSVPEPIFPEDIVVGIHGLIVRLGGRSGLLLPQVATENGWDAPTFLDHTCRKAGLGPGAWRQPGAELLGFTATVFGERRHAE